MFIELAAFALVALLIVVTINVNTYRQMVNGAHETLTKLAENGGLLPPFSPVDKALQGGGIDGVAFAKKGFGVSNNAESEFTTRYYSAVVDSEGNIVESDLTHIASVSEENLQFYTERAFASPDVEGSVDIYRFAKVEDGDNTVIYFIDCYIAMQYVQYVLSLSVAISLVCMAVASVFVYIFSGIIVKPISKAYEKQKRFITDAGHELKTPITAISANLEVLTLQNGKSETVNRIDRQLKNLSGLVNELLALSRADFRERKAEANKPVDFSELIRSQIPTFEVPAREQGKAFNVNVDANVAVIGQEADMNRLYSVLADNAVKYCAPGGKIETSLTRVKKCARLIVKNTCEPIPSAELPRLFERFYRADSSRSRETGGYGIGLSVAKAITEKYGGKIRAYNGDGCVCFEATLPVCRALRNRKLRAKRV